MLTQERLPTSDGSVSTWSALNLGSKYSEVDDPINSSDDDSTYIYRVGLSATNQLFGFTPFDLPDNATVSKVLIKARSKFTAGTAPNLAGLLYINLIVFVSTTQIVTGSYVDYSFEWTTNPNTSIAWTVSEVESIAEFGVRRIGGNSSTQIRVTQCYAQVQYEEAVLTRYIPFFAMR